MAAFFIILLIGLIPYRWYGHKWQYHACYVAALHLTYAWQWVQKEYFSHTINPGWVGVELFWGAILTGPLCALLHLGLMALAAKDKNRRVVIIHAIGLVLLALHIAAVFN